MEQCCNHNHVIKYPVSSKSQWFCSLLISSASLQLLLLVYILYFGIIKVNYLLKISLFFSTIFPLLNWTVDILPWDLLFSSLPYIVFKAFFISFCVTVIPVLRWDIKYNSWVHLLLHFKLNSLDLMSENFHTSYSQLINIPYLSF